MASIAQTAAEHLLGLYRRLDPEYSNVLADSFGCTPEELVVFSDLFGGPLPAELVEFLCLTLPVDFVECTVFNTEGPAGLRALHDDDPVFENAARFNLFGLGWWGGESDGDSWLYDFESGGVFAVGNAESETSPRSELLEVAYERFDSLVEWVAFLEAEAAERGLLAVA